MTDIAIQVENLSKMYRIGGQQARYKRFTETVTDILAAPLRRLRTLGQPISPAETLWALKEVSFEVKEGEVVGIIGRNGAGKSTLLKILSRITEPTEGVVRVYGRVGSLLEVGTGFHPELTGRENIYLNGTILGMRRAEIDRKFDEIVAFAEVEKFLDTPVKRYSSGMYVRLAFAVAAHLEPEILVVDEVLAVGDAQFQKKCLGKMGEVAKEGRTVLFVSHNMAAIEALCKKAFWLDAGRLEVSDKTEVTIDAYLRSAASINLTPLKERRDRHGDGKLRFTAFEAYQTADKPTLVCGCPANLVVYYEAPPGLLLQNVHISIGVNTVIGENVLYLSNDLIGAQFSDLPNLARFVCYIDKLPLTPGTYSINIYCTVNGILADWVIDAVHIFVEQGDYFGSGRLTPSSHSKVLVEHQWSWVAS